MCFPESYHTPGAGEGMPAPAMSAARRRAVPSNRQRPRGRRPGGCQDAPGEVLQVRAASGLVMIFHVWHAYASLQWSGVPCPNPILAMFTKGSPRTFQASCMCPKSRQDERWPSQYLDV